MATRSLAKKSAIVLAVALAVAMLTGSVVLSGPQFGAPPDEQRALTFESSMQFDKDMKRFRNRRPGLIDKDREEALNLEFVLEWFAGTEDSAPRERLPERQVDLDMFLYGEETLKFIWLGHSSLMLNIEGTIVLIDPVFSGSASPFSFLAKRFQPPVIGINDLSDIDLILISHDHYDHLDMKTVKNFIQDATVFVAPLGVGSHLAGWGVPEDRVVEKDWMESFSFKGIEFTAAPSQHFSGRGLSDENRTLWASWVIRTANHSIYFSGDSGYDTHFKHIGERFGPFDLAFMENGQYDDRFKAAHMLTEEVARAYKELKAEKVFPIHWGMFALNTHAWHEPPKRLLDAVEIDDDVVTPLIGYLYDIDNLPTLDRWWEYFAIEGNMN